MNTERKLNVVYLIGAGASHQAFPINRIESSKDLHVAETPRTLAEDMRRIGSEITTSTILRKQELTKQARIIGSHLERIGTNSSEFGSVDTYAKYCYVHKWDEYKWIKISLAFYFHYKTLVQGVKEPRVLHFFTHLVNSVGNCPEHIKFISWNYDFQFQECSENKFKSRFINAYNGPDSNFVQLNGTVGPTNGILSSEKLDRMNKRDIIEALVECYLLETQNSAIMQNVSFAWECDPSSQFHSPVSSQRIELAQRFLQAASTMVIIGYSFPYFNREIDKVLMDQFTQNGFRGKKIYYQDPYSDGKFLVENFNLPLPPIPINDVRNYHFPIEL